MLGFRNTPPRLLLAVVGSLAILTSGIGEARETKSIISESKVSGALPLKVEKGDPTKSFWDEQVQYPFPVKYRMGRDNRGIGWEIAFMDEYRGTATKPPVLVLIHGKGANAGYYSELMKAALAKGFRVIAPDIPHYGKSIPGNRMNPLARTLQDTREAIHEVIVNRLGVKKAIYLGHSLGGQWVTGYALTWPENVEKVILVGSGGLEEYPTVLNNLPLFDPEYQYNYNRWKTVWDPVGHLGKEYAKDEEAIRLFYYFKTKDKSGAIVPSKAGYFFNDSEDARFLTEARVQMIKGNKKEYENYIITYIRDIYTMSIETRKEDPRSLYKRIKELKMPLLITYGDKEPYIPVASLSGKKYLKSDVIKPVFDVLSSTGNVPVVKIYPGAGHFVHTDFPQQFNEDVLKFATEGKVDGSVPATEVMRWKDQ